MEPTRHARLEPLRRLELLADAGTLSPLRSRVTSRVPGRRPRAGDGVVAGVARVGGRPVACYAQDGAYLGGSVGVAHGETILRVLELAGRAGMPVVAFVESGGARIHEGTAALHAYARIFRAQVELSARVPQLTVVSGASAGGGCYSPGLADFVILTSDATMSLTGPRVVEEALGERISAAALGGHEVHDRTGVADVVAVDGADAIGRARDLLAYLPSRSGDAPPYTAPVDPEPGDPAHALPAAARQVYDVRSVVRALVDRDSALELAPRWARNMVTILARLGGRSVAVVANQPRYLGGTIDTAACEKAVRFVGTCDRLGLPLLVLVDTPGFLPGASQERAAVIRHGANLVRAFAAATVPRFTLILRKAFGGAYIAMNSRDLGADLVLAWPGAQIGIMGAHSAVGVVNARELAEAPDAALRRGRLAAEYARDHLDVASAAAAGYVDEVISPKQTRRSLLQALAAVETDGHSGLNIPQTGAKFQRIGTFGRPMLADRT